MTDRLPSSEHSATRHVDILSHVTCLNSRLGRSCWRLVAGFLDGKGSNRPLGARLQSAGRVGVDDGVQECVLKCERRVDGVARRIGDPRNDCCYRSNSEDRGCAHS
jgi:hypothetical protein